MLVAPMLANLARAHVQVHIHGKLTKMGIGGVLIRPPANVMDNPLMPKDAPYNHNNAPAQVRHRRLQPRLVTYPIVQTLN